MKALACAIALASSGCFTSWAVTQGFGGQKVLDEGVREQTVPLDGVSEKLGVTLPLEVEYDVEPAVANGSNPQTVAPQNKTARPFALTCSTKQYAQDRVYHSAFRYGSRWKKMTGIGFLLEAALGTAFLLMDRNRDQTDPMKANDRSGLLAGGFLAIDAVGTLAIFFIPRKEVFTVDDKAVMTPIRDDCPDGLVLDIAGTSFPIDAAGRIGEMGEVALDEWMRAPSGTIALTFEGRVMPMRLDAREVCAWMRARHADDAEGTQRACATPGTLVTTMDLPRYTTAVITVPTGSLSMAAAR
jgi:hypothetical protein